MISPREKCLRRSSSYITNQVKRSITMEHTQDLGESRDERCLELPSHLSADQNAIELITVWFANNKVTVMTRSGTGLDSQPAIWGEILASIGENIALSMQSVNGENPARTLTVIKASLDETWISKTKAAHSART